jgi:hypothetical protein
MTARIYAYIPGDFIVEIILPIIDDGAEIDIPIEDRYTPDFAALCVDISDIVPMPSANWLATKNGDAWTFSPPPVYTPSPAEILATNTAYRNQLLAAANLVIPALQDAVDLDDPSANPALLLAWKQFRVNVNKVNLTLPSPTWPVPPQSGYGAAITPPVSST